MLNIRRISAIFWRQTLVLRGNVLRPIQIFYWSTIEIFLWGVITGYLDRAGVSGLHVAAVILGAVILSSFLNRTALGVSTAFLEDVWTRNFINLFSSPLSLSEYLAGLVGVTIAESLLSLGFIAALAWFFWAYNVFLFGLLLIPFAAILFVFGLAVGIFTTSVVLRFGPGAEMFAWSVPALIAPLSAVFYPVSALPPFFQKISALIPASHVFEGMRAVVRTGSLDTRELAIGFLLALLCFGASYLFLYRSYRSVLRRGTFTRFATE